MLLNAPFISVRPALACLLLAAVAACGERGGEPDGAAAAATEEADLVVRGGLIYTGLAGAPTVEAVAVDHGRVVFAGSAAEAAAFEGPLTEIVDLQGAAMYPGFVDAHAHLLGIGMRELTLNLEGVASIEELVDIVAAEAAEAEAGETIYGRGWIETGWPEARFPARGDLDPVSPNNPVVLFRADGHAAVVNSAALAAAGIDAATADPAGGRIERDAAGQPTGILIDNAMELVSALVGAPTAAQADEAYAAAARVYAAYGWTGLHNMSVAPEEITSIERLAAAGEVPLRVYNALDPAGLDWLADNAPKTDATGRVVTRAMKLYVDGALGSRGAALAAPYADQPETSGLLLLEKDEAIAMMTRAREEGVQVSTHAIGDRGNTLVLDWYQEVLGASEGPAPRWRIEHAQIVDPADIPRFAAQGVIASMQPSHAIGDLYFAPARLGPERLVGAYAWRSLLDAGAVIAGGSDAPVERGDPLIEFYAAVARKSLDGFSGEGWRPEERVSRAEALAMFTAGPAYASFQEDALGSIEVGKRADFTVFSKDIMAVPEEEILTARALMTIVDGKIVYRAAE